jgi:flagella basal body P-ring formation protein FlgA
LTRAVAPGQALRVDMVRARSVVQAGDPVRLRIVGAGFAISAAGHALVSAGEGQPVRVRTELGKVLTGVAREGRQVDVAL